MILRNSTVTPRNGIYSTSTGRKFLFLSLPDQEPPCWKNSHTSLICVVSWQCYCCHLRSEAMQGCNVRNEGNHAVTSCSSSSNHCSEEKKHGNRRNMSAGWMAAKDFCFSLSFIVILPGVERFQSKTTVWLCKGPVASIVLTPSSSNFDSRPFKRRLAFSDGMGGWLLVLIPQGK